MIRTALLFTLLATTTLSAHDLPRSNNDFALSLYEAAKETSPGNFVYSPYSLFSCLSAVYIGAKGETAEKIEAVLHLKGEQNELPSLSQELLQQLTSKGELKVAHHLYFDEEITLLPDFCRQLQRGFRAQIGLLDFTLPERARKTINASVFKDTEGKIPELLREGSIAEETRLVLTSTAYFKGAFAHPFQERYTQIAPFYQEDGQLVPAQMMSQLAPLPYFENEAMQLLLLPFTGPASDFAFFVMLPKENGLGFLEEKLCACLFNHALNGAVRRRVQLTLPKFTLTHPWEMNQALSKMGMALALSQEANFSGIDGKRDLYLGRIAHETFFSLDESGVTAAAATGATFNVTTSIDSTSPIIFNANHPFIFGIIDLKTKTLLFFGKHSQPCPL
jgi:serpin B